MVSRKWTWRNGDGHLATLLAMVVTTSAAKADIDDAMAKARSADFATSGQVQCAQEVGEALGPCAARIARDGRAAVVVVTFPNGFARRLSFADGAFLRGDTTMSGNGTDTDWRLENGTYVVRVDDQQFEIPETLVFEQ